MDNNITCNCCIYYGNVVFVNSREGGDKGGNNPIRACGVGRDVLDTAMMNPLGGRGVRWLHFCLLRLLLSITTIYHVVKYRHIRWVMVAQREGREVVCHSRCKTHVEATLLGGRMKQAIDREKNIVDLRS